MKVAERTVVTMDYVLKYPDGEIIESSIESNQPIEFVYGKGLILPALEKAILGLEEGETKTVTLTPEEAYGPWKEEGVVTIPKNQFPQDTDLEEGMMFMMESEEGGAMPMTVVRLEGDDVVVDFNHPLAGESLVFDITVKNVREATLEELLQSPSGCGPSCDKGCC